MAFGKVYMKIHHFNSGVNGFRERIRVVTDTSFAVGRLNYRCRPFELSL